MLDSIRNERTRMSTNSNLVEHLPQQLHRTLESDAFHKEDTTALIIVTGRLADQHARGFASQTV